MPSKPPSSQWSPAQRKIQTARTPQEWVAAVLEAIAAEGPDNVSPEIVDLVQRVAEEPDKYTIENGTASRKLGFVQKWLPVAAGAAAVALPFITGPGAGLGALGALGGWGKKLLGKDDKDKPGGGLSARDWLDLALGVGNVVAPLVGANKAADASAEAARIQADAYREGLAFLKEQWAKYNTDFEPYLKAGQAAVGRLSTAASERPPLPVTPSAVLQARISGAPALGAFGQPRPTAPPTQPVLPSSAPPASGVSTTMPVPRPVPQPLPTSTTQPAPRPWSETTNLDDGTHLPDGRVIPYGPDNPRPPRPVLSPAGPPLQNPDTGPVVTPDHGQTPPSLGTFGQPPVSSAMPVAPRPQLVKIQAPDGEIREMPDRMANAFIARGARRVG